MFTYLLSHKNKYDSDQETNKWITMNGIISDLWKSYKFEPFGEKVNMLFKSIGFEWEEDKQTFIKKHIEVRNCVQHHSGKINKEMLERMGIKNLNILDKADVVIVSENIFMTFEELQLLCDHLTELAFQMDIHVHAKLPARRYISAK